MSPPVAILPDMSEPASYEERPQRAVDRLAAAQHGVIGWQQARSLGLSDSSIRHALRSGRWEVVHRGVYRVASSPESQRQRLVAACLWAGEGSCVSHSWAAVLWGMPVGQPSEIEISSPRNLRNPPEGVKVRHADLMPSDLGRIDGSPVTDPCRTLLDLCGFVDEATLEVALDDALRRRLVTLPRLRWRLRGAPARGKAGMGVLRRLVLERTHSQPTPESPLETLFMRLVRKSRLPRPVGQYEIRRHGRFVARVDFAYAERKIAIEVEGYAYHAGKRAWQRDLDRRNTLQMLGWVVVHVTSEQLRHRPEEVIATLRGILELPSKTTT